MSRTSLPRICLPRTSLVVAVLATLAVAGCGTVAGIGEDISSTARAVQRAL